jgi:hypothetical protein
MSCLSALALILATSAGDAGVQINPYPRAVLPEVEVARWSFQGGTDGWRAENHCELSAEGGVLKIRATGEDPFMHRPVRLAGGDVVLAMKARGRTGGSGSVFWTTDRSPGRGEDKARHFGLRQDGQWHEYRVPFPAPGTILDLRIDPGTGAGRFEIESIRLLRLQGHPLSIERVDAADKQVRFTVKNHEAEPVRFTAGGQTYTVPGQGTAVVGRPVAGGTPLEAVAAEIQVQGDPRNLPPVRRTVFLFHPQVRGDWIVRSLGEFSLEVARDGTVARVRREGKPVAALAPLVHAEGKLPAMKLVEESPSLRWEGEGVRLAIGTSGKEISVASTSQRPVEGPVVRALGDFQCGILAGVEYLGKGDASSSRLDCETERHLRFAPDPLEVAFPFASLVTDRAAVAMVWKDPKLQPIYATPNFFDATADHRMALRGAKIEAAILVDRIAVEETIHWAVKKLGLPPLPPEPRSRKQQSDICLAALNGPLKTEQGWGHCAEPNWGRAPHADMASTLWRLTGKIPDMPRLVPGGAHVANGSIYFVTGRAGQWLQYQRQHAKALMAQQRPDGSYRYGGPFRRGHFEDTANGVCAAPAWTLLEYARVTGDKAALEAGVRTLDYMKRFDVPRGAQVWEIPLHSPDQLASAYALWAYVRGYELTGKKEYLAEARRWALSGIPFVYLWSKYPIMLYAAPPVFGATNWQAPMWVGLPVQWVGGVYAYALTTLAPHDKSLDWNHLARGILISAEQQQYPDGQWIGLLPDSFVLASQTRNPARINPCALVSLRMVLDGQVDFLAVAVEGRHRVAAPFPVTIREGKAHLEAQAGLKYQILVDGKVVDVASQGKDVVPLD